jgi:hypothetical protein
MLQSQQSNYASNIPMPRKLTANQPSALPVFQFDAAASVQTNGSKLNQKKISNQQQQPHQQQQQQPLQQSSLLAQFIASESKSSGKNSEFLL